MTQPDWGIHFPVRVSHTRTDDYARRAVSLMMVDVPYPAPKIGGTVSYTVDLPATVRDVDNGRNLLYVTTFSGGPLGHMVQITIGGSYVQLTMDQLADLQEVLTFASNQSLADHPKCDEFEN